MLFVIEKIGVSIQKAFKNKRNINVCSQTTMLLLELHRVPVQLLLMMMHDDDKNELSLIHI